MALSTVRRTSRNCSPSTAAPVDWSSRVKSLQYWTVTFIPTAVIVLDASECRLFGVRFCYILANVSGKIIWHAVDRLQGSAATDVRQCGGIYSSFLRSASENGETTQHKTNKQTATPFYAPFSRWTWVSRLPPWLCWQAGGVAARYYGLYPTH